VDVDEAPVDSLSVELIGFTPADMERALIHPSVLFRFETPVVHATAPGTGKPWKLEEEYSTPDFLSLDGLKQPVGVRLAMGWAATGLLLQWSITSHSSALPEMLTAGRVRFWVDSRASIGIHRLTSTCTHFEFPYRTSVKTIETIAHGSGRQKSAATADSIAAAGVRPELEVTKGSFQVRVFLPATTMPGYQPDEFPNISYFYDLLCGDGSQIPVSVGTQLKYEIDPGLWIRGVLRKP